MKPKDILLRFLIRCGEKGARNPSPRGCYEQAVPESLKMQVVAENTCAK